MKWSPALTEPVANAGGVVNLNAVQSYVIPDVDDDYDWQERFASSGSSSSRSRNGDGDMPQREFLFNDAKDSAGTVVSYYPADGDASSSMSAPPASKEVAASTLQYMGTASMPFVYHIQEVTALVLAPPEAWVLVEQDAYVLSLCFVGMTVVQSTILLQSRSCGSALAMGDFAVHDCSRCRCRRCCVAVAAVAAAVVVAAAATAAIVFLFFERVPSMTRGMNVSDWPLRRTAFARRAPSFNNTTRSPI
jgi:hypothetical protein